MKRRIALLLTIALMGTVFFAANAETETIEMKARNLNIVLHSNNLIYREDGGLYYQLITADGKRLSPKNAEYTSMYETAYGYITVTVKTEDDIHNNGILDERGQILVPPIYADTNLISEKWQIGIKLISSEAENKDYTYSNWKTNEKFFYQVSAADFYFEGHLVGSLSRSDYESAEAFGNYVCVKNRASEYIFYNNKMEKSTYNTSRSKEYEEVYNDRKHTYFHQGTGQQAFVPSCTLSADEVKNAYHYADGVMYDLQGNIVFKTTREYDRIDRASNGYSVARKNGLYGVIDQKGQEIVPLEYDNINVRATNEYLFKYGYTDAVKEGKFGFLNARGDVTCDFLYAENAVKGFSTFGEVMNPDGSITMLSAAVGELPERYSFVELPDYNIGCMAFIAKNNNNQKCIVDLYGNTLVPYDTYESINVNCDGTVAIVDHGDYTYTVYQFDLQNPFDTLGNNDAQNDFEEVWVCENGHGGNKGKFCSECGAARQMKETEPDTITTCPSCGYPFEDDIPNYCPKCGEKIMK